MMNDATSQRLYRNDITRRAIEIRNTLHKLTQRLEGLMNDAGGEEGWADAYETLSDVQSDVNRCIDSLHKKFPQ